MSLYSVALKRAVRTGKVIAKCGNCNATLSAEEHKDKKCLCCALSVSDFDPIYLLPEYVVTS